ncbi:MAG: tetratricopeptide repeat protein [Candidatus Eisenbacteria bacterium]|nr:tetratricopeptide repeat protein [Candidatus Eisenbacteria bacterium]
MKANGGGKRDCRAMPVGRAVIAAVAVLAAVAATWLWISWLSPARRVPQSASISSTGGTHPASRADDATEASLGDLVQEGEATGFNVLLVTLDTTRADRLGCYGYAAAETPTLDALAGRGIRFDDAVSSAPLTMPSHATILTGLSPLSHGVHDNGTYRLGDAHVTLAEVLSARGYDTAAFVGCFVVDARFGLNQGFDLYDFDVPLDGYRPMMPDYNERSAARVTDAAIRWFRERATTGAEAPFFVWVHYFDPHLPYRSPMQRLIRFASRPYDAEIAYVDLELGRLLAALGDLGARDRTLIVVAGDHGEAFGEHEEPTHGMLIYESTVRVPLIISNETLFYGPGRESGRVAGLVDIMPTVEGLLGIDETRSLDGESLLRREAEEDRAIYVETELPLSLAGWSSLRGLRTHTHKYILAPQEELYDLTRDPGEVENVFADARSLAQALKSRLLEMLDRNGPGHGSSRELTDDERERLGSLGYVQSHGQPGSGKLPDPKTMMPVYNDALRSEELYGRGEYASAADLAQSVLDRSDMLPQALRVLAFCNVKLGRADEAVRILRESTERDPDAFLIRSLAQVLIIEGRYADALETLELCASVAPDDGRVPLLRGDVYANQGRNDRAISEYEEAIRIDENRVGIQARQKIANLEKSPARDAIG